MIQRLLLIFGLMPTVLGLLSAQSSSVLLTAGSNRNYKALREIENYGYESYAQVQENVIQVACSRNDTFILKHDGSLWQIGSLTYQSPYTGAPSSRLTPMSITGSVVSVEGEGGEKDPTIDASNRELILLDTNVRQVSAGYGTAAWVKNDNTVWAVGDNWGGGILLPGGPNPLLTPAQIASGVNLVEVAGSSIFIVKTDGSLWAMGDNNAGKLGLGDTVNRLSFVQVVASGVTDVSGTSPNGSNNITLFVQNGNLMGMGNQGTYDALGGGSNYQQSPVLIDTNVVQCAAGDGYTLYVKTDGSAWGLGKNSRGELGLEDADYVDGVPTQIMTGVEKVFASTNDYSFFLRTDGILYGSGSNLSTSVGFVIPGGSESNEIHMPVELMKNVTDAEIGDRMSALIAESTVSVGGDLYFQTNVVTENSFSLDPNGHYGASAVFSLASGSLPGGLTLNGQQLQGTIREKGDFVFTINTINGATQISFAVHIAVLGEPVSVYSQSFYTNTAAYHSIPLDPNGELSSDATFAVEGVLPSGMKIVDGFLKGVFASTGFYSFSIVGVDGDNMVTVRFEITVLTPTLTPMIYGVNFNGTYLPTILMSERTHSAAAVTELMHFGAVIGEPLAMSFDWDFIKGDYSFRVIGGELAPGLVLNGETGEIMGVPNAAGEYLFVISVLDWRGRGVQWINLIITE